MTTAAKTRTTRRKAKDLKPAPYNPREISDHALAGLSQSVVRFGMVQPVVWNKRTGHVVGGHQRLRVLNPDAEDLVDVVEVDLNLTEEKALNLALNNPAIAGSFTGEVDALLEELKDAEPVLFNELLLDEVLGKRFTPSAGKTDPDALPPIAETALSIPGRHRLGCGSAEDPAVVDRVLAGAQPWLMVTDPPYGVSYDPRWREEVDQFERHSTRAVRNDNRSGWRAAYALFTGEVAYVWHAPTFGPAVAGDLVACGLEVRYQLVWPKQHFVFSRGHYHWQHEGCLYVVRKGAGARWAGDRKQSTVWNIPNANPMGGRQDDSNEIHGTQKPVECMERPVRHHGGEGDHVYDPFVGTGTTLIAGERLGRRVFALDVDPVCVDMARRRWAEYVHGKGCQWARLTPAAT